MDKPRKVISMKDYKAKRRIKSLKRILVSPITLMITFLLLVYGASTFAYLMDTQSNPTHGFTGAKDRLMQLHPVH